jgi:hypothetical protein
MNPNLGLLIAFIIFGVIDLTFVGTTTFFVVLLVKKMLGDEQILNELKKIAEMLSKKDKRNFIVKG